MSIIALENQYIPEEKAPHHSERDRILNTVLLSSIGIFTSKNSQEIYYIKPTNTN